MTILANALLTALGCAILQQPVPQCVQETLHPPTQVAGVQTEVPKHTGEAVDVILTAQAAIVWDVETGQVLYEKNSHTRRPVASLSKLVSALSIRSMLSPDIAIEIPQAARRAQLLGANISLPIGHHATVRELLAAGIIPSANDAMVALAEAASGSEEEFVKYVNAHTQELGLTDTVLTNATGLSGGGEQFSTAADIMQAMQLAYEDPLLRSFMNQKAGTLTTQEGAARRYETTNDLLGSYMPVLAAKTGYTHEAGENLVLITEDSEGHTIGAVVLGSDQRFQDMKVLVEWIWRNFTWIETISPA